MKLEKTHKKILQLSDDALKSFDLVEHLTPCGDDLILLTLKGHLIIESLLEMNLTRLLAIESLPTGGGKLGFNNKLKLVQTVVISREPGPNADLFCVIAEFNELRNQLAHRLKSPEEIEKIVKSFVAKNRKMIDVKLSLDTLPMQLKSCILRLCGFLLRVRVHFHKLDQQEDE